MKLYYLTNFFTKQKTGKITPLIYSADYSPDDEKITLKLFKESELFNCNIEELIDLNSNKIRLFSIYSIETDNITLEISETKLLLENNKINWEHTQGCNSYVSNFEDLPWKFEKVISIDKNKLFSLFNFNENNDTQQKDIERLLKIIISGDSASQVLRLYNIINDFNNNTQKCANELYSILYDFTNGDFFDFMEIYIIRQWLFLEKNTMLTLHIKNKTDFLLKLI